MKLIKSYWTPLTGLFIAVMALFVGFFVSPARGTECLVNTPCVGANGQNGECEARSNQVPHCFCQSGGSSSASCPFG